MKKAQRAARFLRGKVFRAAALGSACIWCAGSFLAQTKPDIDWPTYGNDAGGTRYSPAAQIDRGNVDKLKVAWTYRTGANETPTKLVHKAAFS